MARVGLRDEFWLSNEEEALWLDGGRNNPSIKMPINSSVLMQIDNAVVFKMTNFPAVANKIAPDSSFKQM